MTDQVPDEEQQGEAMLRQVAERACARAGVRYIGTLNDAHTQSLVVVYAYNANNPEYYGAKLSLDPRSLNAERRIEDQLRDSIRDNVRSR